jgi:hypothetical protein
MSYSVSVSSPLSIVNKLSDGEYELNPGNIEGDTYFYLNEAVASSTDMYDFWIKPAKDLGLRLLGTFNDLGLYLDKVEEVDELIAEVNRLETYWKQNVPHETFYGQTRLEWLLERSGGVKLAVQLAKEKHATLSIA